MHTPIGTSTSSESSRSWRVSGRDALLVFAVYSHRSIMERSQISMSHFRMSGFFILHHCAVRNTARSAVGVRTLGSKSDAQNAQNTAQESTSQRGSTHECGRTFQHDSSSSGELQTTRWRAADIGTCHCAAHKCLRSLPLAERAHREGYRA